MIIDDSYYTTGANQPSRGQTRASHFISEVIMDSSFFRGLTDTEATEFVQWAKDNFVPDMEVNECWHPVVRQELKRLQGCYEQGLELADNHGSLFDED